MNDRRISRRGFLLVSVLLITMILLALGLTFLGKRAIQYRRAALVEQAAVARCFAESGMEEALAKFQRDLEFPPLAKDQTSFNYTEPVLVDGVYAGSYQVSLDGSRRFKPHAIWRITVTGQAGSDSLDPTAVRTLRAEFDVAKHVRDDTAEHTPDEDPTNPNYYSVINFEDLGGL